MMIHPAGGIFTRLILLFCFFLRIKRIPFGMIYTLTKLQSGSPEGW
jgi:hypothetical protein